MNLINLMLYRLAMLFILVLSINELVLSCAKYLQNEEQQVYLVPIAIILEIFARVLAIVYKIVICLFSFFIVLSLLNVGGALVC